MPFLSSIDLSGSIVGLVYNGHRRYRSSIGGIFSIAMILAIIAISITYLKEFFLRKKPKMSFENKKYWNPPLQNITNSFSFEVLMKYNGITELRNDIIKINAHYISNHGSQTIIDNIPFVRCQRDTNDIEDLFQSFELSKGLCFNVTNLSLNGTQVTDIFKYIQISFDLCMNKDECLSSDQMRSFFETNKPVAYLYFQDSIFQMNDKKQKVTNFYNYYDVNVTFGDSKSANIYFSKNEMLIDESYFFPSSPENYSNFMIDSFRDLVSQRTENQTELLTINLMLSKNKNIIYISYMQLSELLASISALANVIMIIFNFLGEIFNHHIFQSELIQSLFNINDDNRNTNSIKRDIPQRNNNTSFRYGNSSHNKIINLTTKDCDTISRYGFMQKKKGQSIRNIINKVQRTTTFLKKKNAIVIQYKYINMIILSNILPLFHSKKFKEMQKRFNKIYEYLLIYQDQKNILRKMQEIDYLKYLMLTEDQLALYQIIPKPNYKHINKLNTNDFSSLFCWIPFHYLKSKREINKYINDNELKKVLEKGIVKEDKNNINRKLIQSIQRNE